MEIIVRKIRTERGVVFDLLFSSFLFAELSKTCSTNQNKRTALSANQKTWISHVFPALGAGCLFSCAWRQLHVFPRLVPVACFCFKL